METTPQGPLTLEAAGELLGVTGEAVRQRITKGRLGGSQGEDGKWSVDVDGRFLELAEAARLRRRTAAAPAAAPSSPPSDAPSALGAEATAPAAGTSQARIGKQKRQPRNRVQLEDVGAPGELKVGAASASAGGTSGVPASKVSAAQFERAFCAGFGLIAQLRQAPHWRVDRAEVQTFSAEAASLINSLPVPIVAAAGAFSGVGVVAVGIFGIVYSRMTLDAIGQALGQQQQPAQTMTDVESFLAGVYGTSPTGEVVTQPPNPGPQAPRGAAPVTPEPPAGIGTMFGGLAS